MTSTHTTPSSASHGVSFGDAVELLRQRVDIVDIVGRHVVLKRQGRNYVGLCPFHNDKHPSFSVHREKNLYKCFSCGEAGDAFSFIMKRESRTFGETIEQLADEMGILIARGGKSAEDRQQEKDVKQVLFSLNTAAQAWFAQQLHTPAGQAVKAYLTQRGLTEATITQFGLGLAPPGWENLATHLHHTQHASPEQLVEAGLATAKPERNSIYDRFRNRLMIPIMDDRQRVVAFGGRTLDKEDTGPKYLNSPETLIYHKSQVLYGLNPQALRQQQHALVMEGYFDVIAAHQAGFTHSVAVCGTALTEDHARLLRRFDVEHITLCLDADEAGQRATLQALATLKPFPVKVSVLVVPEGKDPADYIQQHGSEGFAQLLMQNTLDNLTYQCQRAVSAYNLTTLEGRANATAAIAPILGQETNPVRFREFVTLWAKQLGIFTEDLYEACQSYRPSARSSSTVSARKSQSSQRKPAFSTAGTMSGAISHVQGALSTHNTPSGINNSLSHPSLSSTSTDGTQTLSTQIAQLEHGWFALLFMNKDSYNFMLPRLAHVRLETPFAQWLKQWLQNALAHGNLNQSMANVSAVLAQLQQTLDNHALSHAESEETDSLTHSEQQTPEKQFEKQQLSVEPPSTQAWLVFHSLFSQLRAETLLLAQQWSSVEDGTFLKRLNTHVIRLEQQLAHAHRVASLNPLVNQIKACEQERPTDGSPPDDDTDLALIELQYAFRDKLGQDSHPLPHAAG